MWLGLRAIARVMAMLHGAVATTASSRLRITYWSGTTPPRNSGCAGARVACAPAAVYGRALQAEVPHRGVAEDAGAADVAIERRGSAVPRLAERCKTSTLQRRLAALSQAHQAAGQTAHEVPTKHATVRAVMSGIRRTKGTAQRGKAAAVTAVVRAMVEGAPDRLLGLRDRALLLLGFSGAFRRSELVALDVEDLEFTGDGLVVTQRRGKTDQEGEGRKIGIPFGGRPDTCPVRAVREWLDAAAVVFGPVFRSVNRHSQVQPGRLSDKAVAIVVKRHAPSAGLDPARYAGHSLRAGLATAAAAAGASERSIMNQTGHRSVPMVRKYIRDGQLFRENAAATVGL